jgi:hypothetical protein
VHGIVQSIPFTVIKAQISELRSLAVKHPSRYESALTHLLDTVLPRYHASRARDTEACKYKRPHVARRADNIPKVVCVLRKAAIEVDFLLHGGNTLGFNKRSIMSQKLDAAATNVEG